MSDKYEEAHIALRQWAFHEEHVNRINELLQKHGAGLWGDYHLDTAYRLLEQHLLVIKPEIARLHKLIRDNPDYFGNPPAGDSVLGFLADFLERQIEGKGG